MSDQDINRLYAKVDSLEGKIDSLTHILTQVVTRDEQDSGHIRSLRSDVDKLKRNYWMWLGAGSLLGVIATLIGVLKVGTDMLGGVTTP